MPPTLHEGMNPEDMTQTQTSPPAPSAVVGHIAGDYAAAYESRGMPPTPDNLEFMRVLARAVVLEIKNHAKITITIDAGPPPTATATIE